VRLRRADKKEVGASAGVRHGLEFMRGSHRAHRFPIPDGQADGGGE